MKEPQGYGKEKKEREREMTNNKEDWKRKEK